MLYNNFLRQVVCAYLDLEFEIELWGKIADWSIPGCHGNR